MQGFDSKLNCATCPDRPKCEQRGTLCAEAERYVNQDSKGRHVRMSRMDIEQMPDNGEPEVLTFRGLTMGLFQRLSGKQRAIAAYLMEGHSVGGIAKMMGISKGTVQGYMKRIKAKAVH